MDIKESFVCYHPYLTFCKSSNDRFISPNGTLDKELNVDTESLYLIAKDAFRYLDIKTKKQFENDFKQWGEFIEGCRDVLAKTLDTNSIVTVNDQGQYTKVDWDLVQPVNILNISWGMTKTRNQKNLDFEKLLINGFLFLSLTEIDNALVAIALQSDQAIVASVEAAFSLCSAVEIYQHKKHLKRARQEIAYNAAIQRIKKDPRQKEKLFIFDCWNAWQKKPQNYRSKADFARDMLMKVIHLKSQKKIEDWCREWEADL